MSRCQALTYGGGMCGRLAGLEVVMVRGPGFRSPEPRLYCARCRGEEVRLRAPEVEPRRVRPPRPRCSACSLRDASASGLCYICRNALGCHVRDFPDRLPRPHTNTYRALETINLDVARGYKRGAVIVALRARLSGVTNA